MRALRCSFVMGLTLVAASCAVFASDDALAEKTADDRCKVHAFDGILVERGLIPGDPSAPVRSRVRFRAPSDLLVDVQEPESYAGDTLARIGSTIEIYSRRLGAGVRMRNVRPLDVQGEHALVEAVTRFDLATYGYREGSGQTVAGRDATSWTATPRVSTFLGDVSRWEIDSEFSVPLATTLLGTDGTSELYSMHYEEARFFEPGDGDALAWAPRDTPAWLDWDLAGPQLSLEQARAAADFSLLEPTSKVEGLTLDRVLQASPRVTTVLALVYEKAGYYVSLSEQKDRGLADKKALGIPVDLDGVAGRIAFAPDTCSLGFVRDGVEASLLTNLPPALAVRFARSLRGRKP